MNSVRALLSRDRTNIDYQATDFSFDQNSRQDNNS